MVSLPPDLDSDAWPVDGSEAESEHIWPPDVPDPLAKRKRRKFKHIPGPKRQSLPVHPLDIDCPGLWGVQLGVVNAIADHVAEVYSPRRLLNSTAKLRLRGDLSADLLTGWDLRQEHRRFDLVKEVLARRPHVLMISPPCTMFSQLQASNWFRMDRPKREQQWVEATAHLHFSMFLCYLQAKNGRGFIFEHPRGALSWQNPQVVSLQRRTPTLLCCFDMCRFGLHAFEDNDRFHKKATMLLTNLPEVHQLIHGKMCQKDHQHVAISGGVQGIARSFWAQHYPTAFCDKLAEAIWTNCHAAGRV